MERQSKGSELWSGPRAAPPPFRSCQAKSWTSPPGLKSRGGGGGQAAVLPALLTDMISSGAEPGKIWRQSSTLSYKIQLLPSGGKPLGLAPCALLSTSRRRQHLRWLGLLSLSASLFSASPCWEGGSWELGLCASMCERSVRWRTGVQLGSSSSGLSQAGQLGPGWVGRVRWQHKLLSYVGRGVSYEAYRSSNEGKVGRSCERPNDKKLQQFLVLGPWQVSLTHMQPCTIMSTTAFGDEEGKVVKTQRRDQRYPSCMDVSSGVCLTVAQIIIFFFGDNSVQIVLAAGDRLEIIWRKTSYPKPLVKRETNSWMGERTPKSWTESGERKCWRRKDILAALVAAASILQGPDAPRFSCQSFKLHSLAMTFGLRQFSRGCRNHLQHGHEYLWSMFRNALVASSH